MDSDEVATTLVVKVIDMQRDSIRQSEGRSPSGNEPVTMKTQGAQQNSTIEHEQGGVSRPGALAGSAGGPPSGEAGG
ncbi:hypothetical protein K7Z75_26135, partial [Mycobacterium avium subsp. hominissuis]|uniref:hypothetical protein n=1 Tax=Mycobacterium avium TaxID=1764 RepID=UPI00293A6C8B